MQLSSALEAHNLRIDVKDLGFDFEVTLGSIQEFAAAFDIGPYLVEVKATSVGPVRLTPTQAETATDQPGRYVLCVVDFTDVPDERLDSNWTRGDVESRIFMLRDVGDRVSGTCRLVREARDRPVGIRNDRVLRYEVQAETWRQGCSISEWVVSIRNTLGAQDSF